MCTKNYCLFLFYKKISCLQKAQNANQETFTLLKACAHKKVLPLLLLVHLFFVCWLMFACECFCMHEIFLLFTMLLIFFASIYYTTNVYPYQLTYREFICTHLFLLVIICENLFESLLILDHLRGSLFIYDHLWESVPL